MNFNINKDPNRKWRREKFGWQHKVQVPLNTGIFGVMLIEIAHICCFKLLVLLANSSNSLYEITFPFKYRNFGGDVDRNCEMAANSHMYKPSVCNTHFVMFYYISLFILYTLINHAICAKIIKYRWPLFVIPLYTIPLSHFWGWPLRTTIRD